MLSMIETALELTNYQISGQDIQILINMGKEILSYKIDIYDGVANTLKLLNENNYKVICITKGDLLDQESKVARSGLGNFFYKVHVVNDKTPEVYQKIINEYEISNSDFVMIGNSLKSDILPVTKINSNAIYIPCDVPWAHEVINEGEIDSNRYIKFNSMLDFYKSLN